jgi:adenine deaminase
MTVFLDHVTDDGLETTLRHIVDAGIDIRHIGFAPLQSTGDGSVNTGNASLLTMIRIALRAGVAPPRAVQMASITAARFYQVEQELGSLAPGRRADILLLDSLDAAAPNTVIANGRLVETNAQDA